MVETLRLILAAVTGIGLGLIFFGGLDWTVHQGLHSKHPALWFCSSLIARTGITLAGIYLVSGFHFERLVACLIGFATAQLSVIFLTRATAQTPNCQKKEG